MAAGLSTHRSRRPRPPASGNVEGSVASRPAVARVLRAIVAAAGHAVARVHRAVLPAGGAAALGARARGTEEAGGPRRAGLTTVAFRRRWRSVDASAATTGRAIAGGTS